MSELMTAAVIGPLSVAGVTTIGALLTVYLSKRWKNQETLEEKSERVTSATLDRMDRELTKLRERVDWCEQHIRTLRERGFQWFRWAYELQRHAIEARARAEPPPRGWEPLPNLPISFDAEK